MPGTFTTAFAQRLNSNCNISVKEAEHGDILKPGHAYLAPGGRQMLIENIGLSKSIVITDASASEKVNYKPSVDLTFGSLAKAFGGDVLGIILTGMGADGREGCRLLKDKGATIWAQDQDSCVVYGMPQAVAVANISSKNINIDDIGSCVQTEMR
jgi:two-component system chemotaxis response regulator CheB